MGERPEPGTVAWRDLTVENAEQLRDFYAEVCGWGWEAHSQGSHDDYVLRAPGSPEAVAGICHALGSNAGLPPQWLMYVVVEDAEAAAQRCAERGGEVLDGPRDMGGGRFACIRDPAGACLALWQPARGSG